jgi:DNA-binding NarL/FixJ family response regulator
MDEDMASGMNLLELLTKRQLEIAELVANGLSARQIANTLRIGQDSIEKMTKIIKQRIGAKSREEIAEIYNHYRKRQR